MADKKNHLRVDRFVNSEDFRSKSRGRNPIVPPLNRTQHGNALFRQYRVALEQHDVRHAEALEPIDDEIGIYLEIQSVAGCSLPLDSLDTGDYRLQSAHLLGDAEIAVIFVPERKREILTRKLTAYLDASRDRRGQPRNRKLFESIASIRIADLRSFWTDSSQQFPAELGQPVWWEVWLAKRGAQDLIATAREFAARVGATLGNSSLSFYGSAVVLVRATVRQLEGGIELISCLSELRRAKETPDVFLEMSPRDQREWADSIRQRMDTRRYRDVSAAILDTGVNFNHPILSVVCNQARATSWSDEWPPYDDNRDAHRQHGSMQAGLAALGDIHKVAVSDGQIDVPYVIESGRLLPPNGNNPPELYGAVTSDTAIKLEQMNPNHRRVFSLAVTASPESLGGQPSSWSSEVDYFTSGAKDGTRRLFVVSAGNNRSISAAMDHWDQSQLAEIEDPAQSWNALTVGAFTDMTTNDDPTYDGWAPFAIAGDLSPASRTSVNWRWRAHAPFKPDVVAEGGNRLLSPDRTEVSDADTVSILTTSGRTNGPVFDTTRDTSAATGLVTRDAAMLMAEYPDLWPETVRGLLAHSAEWNERMFERKGLLERQHSPKVANEVMLRSFGYGIPNLDRARYSADHQLTLIAQGELQPFTRAADATASTDATLNEMHLFTLPWPEGVLRELGETEIKLRVTLSYFVQPNPGRRGYRQRYSYQSHGLRFEVRRPGQTIANFRAQVNRAAVTEEYDGPQGNSDGWRFGPQLRSRGSLHSDIWTGTAADLADMNVIAIYPVSGWWKFRTSEGRYNNRSPYSLVVSIDAPDESMDIYSVVEQAIAVGIET